MRSADFTREMIIGLRSACRLLARVVAFDSGRQRLIEGWIAWPGSPEYILIPTGIAGNCAFAARKEIQVELAGISRVAAPFR